MNVSVAQAARQLEERGLLRRERDDHSARIINYVGELLGRKLPSDLIDFYRERIATLDDSTAMTPRWSEWMGWRSSDSLVTNLLHANAVPVFDDGFGNLYGLDLTPEVATPAVYFFDHERGYEQPEYCAGSSLGLFMLLLADHHRAYAEHWPKRWELKIDPDIDSCPRARAIWAAG